MHGGAVNVRETTETSPLTHVATGNDVMGWQTRCNLFLAPRGQAFLRTNRFDGVEDEPPATCLWCLSNKESP